MTQPCAHGEQPGAVEAAVLAREGGVESLERPLDVRRGKAARAPLGQHGGQIASRPDSEVHRRRVDRLQRTLGRGHRADPIAPERQYERLRLMKNDVAPPRPPPVTPTVEVRLGFDDSPRPRVEERALEMALLHHEADPQALGVLEAAPPQRYG